MLTWGKLSYWDAQCWLSCPKTIQCIQMRKSPLPLLRVNTHINVEGIESWKEKRSQIWPGFSNITNFNYILPKNYHSQSLNSNVSIVWPLTWTCSCVHWSRLTDLTLEMWTPRLRWIPAQRMQTKMPKFQDAHLGPGTERTVLYKCWSRAGGVGGGIE